MADELIQDEQPQDVAEVQPEVNEQARAVSGDTALAPSPTPIDSIHAAATAIAAINSRLDKIDPPKEGNDAQV